MTNNTKIKIALTGVYFLIFVALTNSGYHVYHIINLLVGWSIWTLTWVKD